MMVPSGLLVILTALIISILRDHSVNIIATFGFTLCYFLMNAFTYVKIVKTKKSIEKENEGLKNTVKMELEELAYNDGDQVENAYLQGDLVYDPIYCDIELYTPPVLPPRNEMKKYNNE